MKFYGMDLQGKLELEMLDSLPEWAATDERRIVYAADEDTVYYGTSTGWQAFGADGTSGSSGTSGLDGTSGTSGTSGTDGTSGTGGITATETVTLTNKRITPRVASTADDATAVIDCDSADQYQLTAVANATEFSVSGTPTAGQRLVIRFKDAGVAKAITWNAVFRAIGVTLPTTTVVSKTHYVGAIYNATDSKWDVLAVSVEA